MKNLTFLALVSAGMLLLSCGGASSGDRDVLDLAGPDEQETDGLDLDLAPADLPTEVPACTTDAECEGEVVVQPCQVARCDLARGVCEAAPLADRTLCDDDDKCTLVDTCRAGECVGDGAVDCDDGNLCTADTCNPDAGGRGCVHTPSTGEPCDDGNLCSVNDVCAAGKCLGNDSGCGCAVDADCGIFDDADLCNGALTCQAGKCRVDASSIISCDRTFDSACVRTTCVPQSGLCERLPLVDGAACDDGNPCTGPDHCQAGACSAGEYLCDVCTADVECAPFDDDDLCNGRVSCVGGQCGVAEASVPSCNAANDTQCRRAVCLPGTGACQVLEKDDGQACSDGNLCTAGDLCQSGQCASGLPTSCVDANDCTLDTCDPKAGCVFAFATRPCDDGNACTLVDACSEGACVGASPRDCDDGNACTFDACVPSTGCISTPNADPCEDGNPCTVDDQCSGGVCLGGTNECPCATDGECALHDNADACDGVLVCVNARCVAKPNSVVVCDPSGDTQCRVNACDPATGACGFAARYNGTPCSDGDACTASDACVDGACLSGKALACGDGDPCTSDVCSAVSGCVHETIPGCDGCTTDEACVDADPCTADTCSDGACFHVVTDGLPCDDADACTQGDHCAAGACTPGELDVCSHRPCASSVDLACEQTVQGNLGLEGMPAALAHYGCNEFDFQGPEQVYRFVASQSGSVAFTLFGENNLYVLLLEDYGAGCDTMDCVGYHTLEVDWLVQAGTTYYVVVDGYAGATEGYELRVDCSWTAPEVCADDVDNDLDGLVDCDDPDCAASLSCLEASCDNALDDEHDGLVDCDDPDCFFHAACTGGWTGETCDDSFVLAGGEPIELPADSSVVAFTRRFTTVGAADDYLGSCAGAPGGPDVAYLFTLDAATAVSLSVTLPGDEAPLPNLVVYAPPLCLPEYELACVSAGATNPPLYLPAGQYFVVVDSATADGATFEVRFEFSRPPLEESVGHCDDGADNDFDGVSDCSDATGCAVVPWCSAVDECVASADVVAGVAAAGSTAPGHRDLATNVLTQYECPGETQFGYWGPEFAWRYTATCAGSATAELTVNDDPEAPIDLFVLDAGVGCIASACTGFANALDGRATLQFSVLEGADYLLVADGYLGAVGDLSLSVSVSCLEVCDNLQDDDDDGLTDCDDDVDCPQGTFTCPSAAELDCGNDYDEDQDGDTDCDDPDCLVLGACPELACADGQDDDLDGSSDCADDDCAAALICASPLACAPRGALTCGVPVHLTTQGADVTDAVRFWTGCDAYGLDYSGAEVASSFVSPCTGKVEVRLIDRAIDPAGNLDVLVLDPALECAGGACTQAVYGAGAGLPTTGLLNVTRDQAVTLVVDGWQGYTSSFELVVDCLCLVEDCTDALDNDGDGVTDCDDDECALHDTCPERDCADALDNDGDGVTDCDDAPCAATPACPELDCANDRDDNRDGATDCADLGCFEDGACTAGFGGATCADAYPLNRGSSLGVADAGRVETRWGTVFGAGADHESLVTCASWTEGDDRAYVFETAADLVLEADLHLEPGAAGGLVLFSGTWGCDGPEAQEFALGCAPAEQGAASLSRLLEPGRYFLLVEGSGASALAGRYRLDVRFEAPSFELRCADGLDDDLDDLVDCDDAADCGAALVCAYPATCAPKAAVACGGSTVSGMLPSNDATDAVSTYACVPSAGAAYHGPELTWEYTATCAGTVTATLAYTGAIPDQYFDLFVLDGSAACDGQACVAMGVFDDVSRKATIAFPAAQGASFLLVVDGFDGALGPVSLDVVCACN